MDSKTYDGRVRAGGLRRTVLAIGIAAAGASTGAFGFSVDTGNPDLQVLWDNTIRATAGWQFAGQWHCLCL